MGENLQNLRAVFNGLKQEKRADGRGSLYVFCAAKSACGTSYVARKMAMLACESIQKGEQVLLVDMDIQNNTQSRYFFTPAQHAGQGMPQGPYGATFGVSPFWQVTPYMVGSDGRNISDAHFVSLYAVDEIPLLFTHFHWEYFKSGQSVHIQNARAYWHKLREHFAYVIVDTPALDRTDILAAICPEADANILVSTTQESRQQNLADAADHLAAIDARCTGVILNEMPASHMQTGGAL